MARYYRRRYTRVVKPKKRWASNIYDLAAGESDNATKDIYIAQVLVQNAFQDNTPTPTIIKVGNFKVQMDVSYTTNSAAWVDVKAVIMFVPEGTDVSSYFKITSLIEKHPEWVMAWKYSSIDYTGEATTTGVQTMQFSSRLKRNLNSGDKIYIFTLLTTNVNEQHITKVRTGGLCQYWTCAN